MKLEIGKFYRHLTGQELAIVGEAETTMYGKVLVAETNRFGYLIPIGRGESNATNYKEISKKEWMRNFSIE